MSTHARADVSMCTSNICVLRTIVRMYYTHMILKFYEQGFLVRARVLIKYTIFHVCMCILLCTECTARWMILYSATLDVCACLSRICVKHSTEQQATHTNTHTETVFLSSLPISFALAVHVSIVYTI